jgi:hypothetical protein
MTRAAPWSATKADRRVVSPDEEWAAEITRAIVQDCHPWQADAVIDPAKQVSLLIGRGGAKTTTKRARAIIKLINLPRQRVGFAATSADHARELNWDKLKDVCENYKIRTVGNVAWSTGSGPRKASAEPDVTFLDTKMIMTCTRTGSIYRLRGVEDKKDAEKFRGFPMAEFQFDEAGSSPPVLLEYLLETCVSPRLGEALALPPMNKMGEFLEPFGDHLRGGCKIVGSTPPAALHGEFYEITREASSRHRPYAHRDRPEFAEWEGYSSHSWTLKDVVDLPDSARLYPALVANWKTALKKKTEKGWSDDHPTWMREYLGLWSADDTSMMFRYRPHVDGEEWNQWNPHGEKLLEGLVGLKAAIEALPLDENGKPMAWYYAYGMDSGSRDPFALNIFAFSPQDRHRRILHVYAFERTGMYARTIAQILLGADETSPNGCFPPDKPKGCIGLTGWPIGMVLDSDQNMIDELTKVYGIIAVKAERRADYKFGAIELVNGDFVEGFIKILKGSPLERQLVLLQWKPDDFGNPREDKAQANHSSDTLILARKLIAHLFESGSVSQESGKRPPAYQDPQGLDEIGEESGSDDYSSLLSEPDWDDLAV